MPIYGSLQTGSRQSRNMVEELEHEDTREMSWRIGNILRDPFSLATIGVGIAGFLITLIASVMAATNHTATYPNFSWMSLCYMLVCIIAVILAVGMNVVARYHVSLIGFISAGVVLSMSSVNALIYVSDGAHEAAAAGFILLSMVSLVWIFRYGEWAARMERGRIARFLKETIDHNNHIEGELRHKLAMLEARLGSSGAQHSPINNIRLPMDMEQLSPRNEKFNVDQDIQTREAYTSRYPESEKDRYTAAPDAMNMQNGFASSSANQPSEYPFKAKAIYTYQANPDDANEIGFEKHEILEISDTSGRWWQARKTTGETGIAPSNYLILM